MAEIHRITCTGYFKEKYISTYVFTYIYILNARNNLTLANIIKINSKSIQMITIFENDPDIKRFVVLSKV